jgi:maltose/moltooligosaccharide transporter
MTTLHKPHLSFWQIINMNVGFFGIQFSFGLQQSNMSPIYGYLGADEASLPYLWLAGPMTGLIVQPIIGAMSDKTTSKLGRRTPYFLIGALLCSLGLLFMPFSPTLWMAASLLWILDTGNNVTMEPYRAFVSDKLSTIQTDIGFLVQSAFTGLAQTLAYLSPVILVWIGMNKDSVNSHHIPYITITAFIIGAFFSLASILWSVKTTPEIPLNDEEIEQIKKNPLNVKSVAVEIKSAFLEMPLVMKQLAVMMLFQWYAMFCYWQYITLSLATTFFGTTDATTQGFRDAGLINAKIGGFYNFMSFVTAFAMIPIVRRIGAKYTHAACLTQAGLAMLSIPSIHSQNLLFIPMIGVGLAWASIMGNPYSMLAHAIPKERVGIYMGIFNMFIVVPMFIQIMTLPLYYKSLLHGNPENVIRLAGALLLMAALAGVFVSNKHKKVAT